MALQNKRLHYLAGDSQVTWVLGSFLAGNCKIEMQTLIHKHLFVGCSHQVDEGQLDARHTPCCQQCQVVPHGLVVVGRTRHHVTILWAHTQGEGDGRMMRQVTEKGLVNVPSETGGDDWFRPGGGGAHQHMQRLQCRLVVEMGPADLNPHPLCPALDLDIHLSTSDCFSQPLSPVSQPHSHCNILPSNCIIQTAQRCCGDPKPLCPGNPPPFPLSYSPTG